MIFGYGEGGMIALYAAALDPRIEAVCVSGFFGDRSDVWRQPVDRNVFGLLEQFGDAEVASLIAPRLLVVEASKGPEFVIPPGTGGAPGRLTTPKLESSRGRGREGAAAGDGFGAGSSNRAGRQRARRKRTVWNRRGARQALVRCGSAAQTGARSRIGPPSIDGPNSQRFARIASFTSSTGTTSSFWSRAPTFAASS